MIKHLKNNYLLLIILLLGLVLRLRFWPDYLTFDYEKARDLIASRNIYLNHKLTLLGPITEVEGIYHGPLYYYLVGLFYFIFKGDPKAGSIISFGFNIGSILIIYIIGKNLFNKTTGLISAFIYAVSFESISYAYWLSNPGPSIPFLFLMYFFLYKYQEKSQKYLIFAFFCLGITIQFQILNSLFLISLLAAFFLLKKPLPKIKFAIAALFAFLIPLSTFIIFELRHNFLMLGVFFRTYFQGKSSDFNLSNIFIKYFSSFSREFSNVIFPAGNIFGYLFMIACFLYLFHQIIYKKDRKLLLLLVWLMSSLPIFIIPSRMSQSSAAFIGVSGAIILIFSNFIDKALKTNKLFPIIIVVLVFSINVYSTGINIRNHNKRMFDFFQGQFYKIDIAIVKYIYKEAGNNSFKLDTVTSPLLISDLWDYLINWYSQKNNLTAPKRSDEKVQFLIIEPYVDEFYKNQAMKKKALAAEMVSSEYFGGMAVQKWILK